MSESSTPEKERSVVRKLKRHLLVLNLEKMSLVISKRRRQVQQDQVISMQIESEEILKMKSTSTKNQMATS
jgi:hypothetical protein